MTIVKICGDGSRPMARGRAVVADQLGRARRRSPTVPRGRRGPSPLALQRTGIRAPCLGARPARVRRDPSADPGMTSSRHGRQEFGDREKAGIINLHVASSSAERSVQRLPLAAVRRGVLLARFERVGVAQCGRLCVSAQSRRYMFMRV